MSINPDDEEVEKGLKLAHIDMYHKRLIERQRRKRFVLPLLAIRLTTPVCADYD